MVTEEINVVKLMIDQLGDLPAAPVILAKALKLTSNVHSNINEISKNISADQSLTAKVIRLSNSPIYGRSREISSLSESIIVLGLNEVKSIIITASAAQMFQSGPHAKTARILWEHSLATALGARLIVKAFGGVDHEEAYLCGLLHDIGKLVMLKSIPDTYEKIIEKVKSNKVMFIKAEVDLLGYNHVHVGKTLLKKWGFPEKIVSQIGLHHSTRLNKVEAQSSLGRVTAIANSISKYIGASFFEAYQSENESLYFLGDRLISEDELIALRVDIEAAYNQEMNNLYG